jgi:light-regulated signal transduction histidine kinase (bacteriophytochrome)
MRADAHYVEQLDGSTPAVTVQYIAVHAIDVSDAPGAEALPSLADSIKRHGVLEPLIVQRNNGTYKTIAGQKRLAAARAAGLRDVPCLVHHVGDDRARALREALRLQRSPSAPAPHSNLAAVSDAQMAEALSALTSCAGLLAPSTPSLTRTVAVDLVQAEVWRMRCLFQAARVVRYGVTPTSGRVFPRELIRRVLESAEPERRLRGLSIDTEITVADARTLHGDAELLRYGLSSLLLATIALLDGVSRARILLAANAPDTRLVVAVSQDRIGVEDPSLDRPGPVDARLASATLSILALRRIAESHDGRVSVVSAGGGARVSLDLPLDAAHA